MKKMIAVICLVLFVQLCGCAKQPTHVENDAVDNIVVTTEAPTEETIREHVAGVDSENVHEENPFETENMAGNQMNDKQKVTQPSTESTPQEDDTSTDETKENKTEDGQMPTEAMSEYEVFQNMSGVEQKAYMESFDSVEAFFEWLNNARSEHETGKSSVLVGDEPVELG